MGPDRRPLCSRKRTLSPVASFVRFVPGAAVRSGAVTLSWYQERLPKLPPITYRRMDGRLAGVVISGHRIDQAQLLHLSTRVAILFATLRRSNPRTTMVVAPV